MQLDRRQDQGKTKGSFILKAEQQQQQKGDRPKLDKKGQKQSSNQDS